MDITTSGEEDLLNFPVKMRVIGAVRSFRWTGVETTRFFLTSFSGLCLEGRGFAEEGRPVRSVF